MSAPRRCKNKECGGYFKPDTVTDYPRQEWCSSECKVQIALQHRDKARQMRERAVKKAHREQKRKVRGNDKRIRREAAVREFNRYIRLRDRDKPCISCGAPAGSYKLTCGHFITAGSCTVLRFDPLNANGQCWWNCNRNKSGNITGYRKGIIERYGEAEGKRILDYLEGPQPTIKITVDFYREIEEEFKAKCREIENA